MDSIKNNSRKRITGVSEGELTVSGSRSGMQNYQFNKNQHSICDLNLQASYLNPLFIPQY